jgi:hypothetical protein
VTSLASRTTSLLAAVAVLGAGGLLLAGCSSASEGTGEPRATATAGTLDAGFWDASHPPAPESTVSPSPGSWNGVHPPADYRVVLLSAGDVDADGDGETAASAPTQALIGAVDAWADTEDVALTRVQPRGSENVLDAVATAVGKHPDLVISVGNDMVDPIAAMSPSALHPRRTSPPPTGPAPATAARDSAPRATTTPRASPRSAPVGPSARVSPPSCTATTAPSSGSREPRPPLSGQ